MSDNGEQGSLHTALNAAIVQEIHVALARKDWGQVQLASKLGENEAWVSRRLSRRAQSRRARRPLSTADIERIAEALEVDALDLLPSKNTRRYSPLTDRRIGAAFADRHTRPSSPRTPTRPMIPARPTPLLRSVAP